MPRLLAPLLSTLLLATFGALALHAADDLKEVNFGVISTEASSNLKEAWEPFRADMEKSIGMPVKCFFAPDYAGVIEAMRFKKIECAWFGNKSAIEAVDRSGAEIFAQVVDSDGNMGYNSLVIVHKDSPFQSIDEIISKGKELAFGMGDPNSTSGTLVPGYYIFAQKGIDPKTHFKRCTSAKHEANALSVVAKQLDAATFNTEAMFRLEQTAPDKAKEIRAIWKSPLIPSDPIVYRTDLPETFKTKMKEFFTTYGKTDEQKAKIKPLKWSGFRPSNNDQLIPIRQLDVAKKKAEAMSSKEYSDAERNAKIAEYDAKLAELKARVDQLAASAPK